MLSYRAKPSLVVCVGPLPLTIIRMRAKGVKVFFDLDETQGKRDEAQTVPAPLAVEPRAQAGSQGNAHPLEPDLEQPATFQPHLEQTPALTMSARIRTIIIEACEIVRELYRRVPKSIRALVLLFGVVGIVGAIFIASLQSAASQTGDEAAHSA